MLYIETKAGEFFPPEADSAKAEFGGEIAGTIIPHFFSTCFARSRILRIKFSVARALILRLVTIN